WKPNTCAEGRHLAPARRGRYGPDLMRGMAPRLPAGLLVLGLTLVAPASRAAFGVPPAVPDYVPVPAGAPALRYARLDRVTCENELERRAIPFSRVDGARGVLA